MTLALTPDMLRTAYDYLCETPPFCRWNLPDSDDVRFLVVGDPTLRGWYKFDDARHVIAISRRCIGHTVNLIATMAHEMIHLHEQNAKACGRGEHSAAFNRWAAQVCKAHGFDPFLF